MARARLRRKDPGAVWKEHLIFISPFVEELHQVVAQGEGESALFPALGAGDVQCSQGCIQVIPSSGAGIVSPETCEQKKDVQVAEDG